MLKILVLGSTGLIGNTILRVLAKSPGLKVRGTIRNSHLKALFPKDLSDLIICNIDLTKLDKLLYLIS